MQHAAAASPQPSSPFNFPLTSPAIGLPCAPFIPSCGCVGGKQALSRGTREPSNLTAGNLVFAGDTEGYIKAFNATTGAQLWSFYCGTAVMGGVNTFTVDGKQVLAVVAGQAGTAIETGLDQDWPKTHQKGGYLIAFELH